MSGMPVEKQYVAEVEAAMWRRNFTPQRIAYVLGLLRDQHAPETAMWREFEAARKWLAVD